MKSVMHVIACIEQLLYISLSLSLSQVVDHIDKISAVRKCSFISAASDIFSAKISGTFKRFVLSSLSILLQSINVFGKILKD